MAIQKKSLISNRAATKKALVTKPEMSTKSGITRIKGAPTRLRAVPNRLTSSPTRLRGL
jgi:hypothetical protein